MVAREYVFSLIIHGFVNHCTVRKLLSDSEGGSGEHFLWLSCAWHQLAPHSRKAARGREGTRQPR